ncbi:MAG: PAS domain S-box protein [Alphaproteobacteria bacterium]|nr:PAS domain S-box protein [Alphaproteobacteria bacterium]
MPTLSLRLQMLVLLAVGLLSLWLAVFFDLSRSRERFIKDAEISTVYQAQVRAENARSTIKRLDEVLFDLRVHWDGEERQFTELVKVQQEHIADIAFQIAVIDKNGILAYSNLSKVTERIDLNEREHFKIHKESGQDKLFISKPLKGKVSGRWSLQFTRPIFDKQKFNGVIVVSVNPETFLGNYERIDLGEIPALVLVSDDGDVMGRYPDNDAHMGKKITGTPYLAQNPPVSGSFRRVAQVDGVERIYGFYKLPEYRLSIVIGEAVSDVLAAYEAQKATILAGALLISIAILTLVFMLYRSLAGREEVAQNLKKSEERYHSLFAGSKAPMLLIDPADGTIQDANHAAQAFYGYSKGELRHLNIGDINILSKQEIAREMEMAKQEQRSHFHFRHRLASGDIRDVEVHSGPIEMQGKPILYSIIHDETDRQRLERERRKLIQAIEQSPVSVVIADTSGNIEFVNPRFLEITGYGLDEVIGKNPRFLKSGKTPEETYVQLWDALNKGDTWQGELCNKRKNGEVYWEQASIAPIFDENGKITHYLGIKEDTTERKKISEELIRSNAELEQFAYVASHDLRQPLRMVTSYLALVERKLGPAVEGDLKEFITFASDGAKRMDQLITGLLEYSRTGRSGEPVDRINLGDVIKESCLNLEIAVQDSNAQIIVAENFPSVQGYWMELVRLFQNLLGNAIKYSFPDRPPMVALSWKREGNEWVVEIRDNGMGMDPKNHKRAFGIFQRLVSNERYEGTGIGLAVCKKIVEHHKGRIWIESALGEGCRFYVAFPVADA